MLRFWSGRRSPAPRGAALLRTAGVPFEEMVWQRQGKSRVGALFLEHALLVSDCLVSAELSCRRNGAHLKRLHTLDLQPGRSVRSAARWGVRLDGGIDVGIVPDAIFAIETRDGSTCLYFLEADRGTMPVRRRRSAQSSFERKLKAHCESWRQRIHRERFGVTRVRALTVTTSCERRDHLIEACSDLPAGQGLFLFANTSQLLGADSDFLTLDWQSPLGGTTQLLA